MKAGRVLRCVSQTRTERELNMRRKRGTYDGLTASSHSSVGTVF